MKVSIPTPLRSYAGAKEIEAKGATIGDVLADLDRRFPGLRFRIVDEQGHLRDHIKIFVNETMADGLATPLREDDHVRIITAISGG